MKRYWMIVLMMVLLISCAGSSKTETKDRPLTFDDYFQLGFKAAEKGNLEEASSQYQRALKIDPKNAEAHLNLGAVYGRQAKGKQEISE
jgi:Tfp pilus assembly protein PilF